MHTNHPPTHYRDLMTYTLTPHVIAYTSGRHRRGEIKAITARDLRYRLYGLCASFGNRPVTQLGPAAIDRWLETIAHKAPATRREYLSTVRGFTRYLQAEGLIKRDPTRHVPAIRQPRHAPVTLTTQEVAALLKAAPDKRALAILWLMVGCGCRCVEVARAQLDDYDPRSKTIRLVGKAGHERQIPVPIEAVRALDNYLDEIGRRGGPLIRSELHPNRGVAPATLSHYVRRWMNEAGVKARPLDGRSAHGLRRTACSDVMEASGSLLAVQEMAGHQSIETTARHYLRRVTMAQLREAMEGRDYSSDSDPPADQQAA